MKILITGGNKSGTTALTFAIAKLYPDHPVITEPASLTPYAEVKGDLIVKFLRPEVFREHKADFEKFDIRIAIVRHPFDRMVSALYYGAYMAVGFGDDTNVNRYLDLIARKIAGEAVSFGDVYDLYREITRRPPKMADPIITQTRMTLDLYQAGLGFHMLRYEDFIVGDTSAIDGVFPGPVSPFIDVPERVARVSRSRASGEWRAWFTEEDAVRFGTDLRDFAECFGYELTVSGEQAPPVPESGVSYIEKLVNEAREKNGMPVFVRGEVHVGPEGDRSDRAIRALNRNKPEDALALMREAVELRSDLPALFTAPLRQTLRGKQWDISLAMIGIALDAKVESNEMVRMAAWHFVKKDARKAQHELRDLLVQHGLPQPKILASYLDAVG